MIIERKEYLEKLIAWKDKQLIKIVTGVRRQCGQFTVNLRKIVRFYPNYIL